MSDKDNRPELIAEDPEPLYVEEFDGTEPEPCKHVFIPKDEAGDLQMERICYCGLPAAHGGEHQCFDCGGRWGKAKP